MNDKLDTLLGVLLKEETSSLKKQITCSLENSNYKEKIKICRLFCAATAAIIIAAVIFSPSRHANEKPYLRPESQDPSITMIYQYKKEIMLNRRLAVIYSESKGEYKNEN